MKRKRGTVAVLVGLAMLVSTSAPTVALAASPARGEDASPAVAGSHISGTVTYQNGSPAAQTPVDLLDGPQDNASAQKVITGSDGEFSFAVGPGQYWLVAYTPQQVLVWYGPAGFVPDQGSSTPIRVTTADVIGIGMVIPNIHAISGRIVTAAGRAVAATVQTYVKGALVSSVYTDSTGRYKIPSLPGTYELYISP
jgi:hypothetical protein